MVYTIIRKRQVFHALANLPSDCNTIAKSLSKRQRRHVPASTSSENVNEAAMEGSHPAQPAEPGTLKATLLETPGKLALLHYIMIECTQMFVNETVTGIEKMTEKESAHPLSPSVNVDVGKSNHQNSADGAEESMSSSKSSVIPVRKRYCSTNYSSTCKRFIHSCINLTEGRA